MKLYATITDENLKQVSKSSNENLEIVIKGENRKNIFELYIKNTDKSYKIHGYNISETSRPDRKSEQYFEFESLKAK